MKIEHVAFNVKDPVAVAKWYVDNLGMKIVSKMNVHPFIHFLADDSGNTLIEIYNNPPENVPSYELMNPLNLHLAFVSADPNADRKRLEKAGALFVQEVRPDDDSLVIMLRDPWGMCIQLCKRGKKMLKDY